MNCNTFFSRIFQTWDDLWLPQDYSICSSFELFADESRDLSEAENKINSKLSFWVKIVSFLWICSFLITVIFFSACDKTRDLSANCWKFEQMEGPDSFVYLSLCYFFPHIFTLLTESTNSEIPKSKFSKKFDQSCVDHVNLTGHQITNLVLNFECLFWFFFSSDIKIRSERSQIHSKLSLLS